MLAAAGAAGVLDHAPPSSPCNAQLADQGFVLAVRLFVASG
jgi:hypothetical protein